jgi:endogenous inhibitor of DNA gyrase (YacG/DUF329 family)
MRCNNCGYDNDSGVGTCIKCGHQLQAGGGYAPNPYQGVYVPNNYGGGDALPKATVVGAYGGGGPLPKATVVGAYGGNEPLPKATVVGSSSINEPIPHPTRVVNAPIPHIQQQVSKAQETHPCPTCGYPVMSDFANCPSCGTPMNVNQPVASKDPTEELLSAKDIVLNCDQCGKEVPANFSFCPYCGAKIQAKTVFRRRHQIEPPKPKCSLTVLPEEDEQVEARVNCYEGESIILSRENTEPANRSITTKKQAELICEDGKWFVTNHSELCSTAVEANRKVEVQSGDVIILGDRRFKFEVVV